MFTHALAQGSLRSADALPPTLTPNAIFAMAPPSPRRLSLLGACLVYASCGLVMTFAPNLDSGFRGPTRTNGGDFVVPSDPPRVVVDLTPQRPPEPAHFQGLTLKNAPLRDAAWTPPTAMDQVPDAPTALPSVNHGFDSVRGGENATPTMVPPGAELRTGPEVPGAAPSIVEFSFDQMRVLSRVDPVYPAMARAAKIQGAVALMMTVDGRGIPTEIRALSSPHPSLEQEALRAARLWRFEPARLNGQAVMAQFRLTLVFRLR